MTKANKSTDKKIGRKKRGVAGVIAGVFLMAIILSTVAVYFVMNLANERARASYEIQSQQTEQAKAAEKVLVIKDDALVGCPSDCRMTVHTTNQASNPMVISYVVLYCTDAAGCPPIPGGGDPNDPVENGPSATLNANVMDTRTVGPLGDNLHYRVDVVTERGNIVSTTECEVSYTNQVCIDSVGSSGPDFYLEATPDAFFLTPGQSKDDIEIRVHSVAGFNDPVSLIVSPTSQDGGEITASVTPGPVTPPVNGYDDTSDLTIDTTPDVTLQTYTFSVIGTDDITGATRSTQVTVSVLDIDVVSAVTEGIIQGTGSIQLDFRSFGAIYPQLGTRDGVVQSGWDSRVASRYSYATGYPGFQLMTISTSGGQSSTQVAFVEVARNLDSSGQDLTFTRHTGINPSAGQVQGTPPNFNYICKGDPVANTFTAYDEDNSAANRVLQAYPVDTPMTVGWEEIYFCSINPGAVGTYWQPSFPFANLNPIFLVARGDFENGAPYGQTVPYQAISVGKFTSILNACLLTGNTPTACPAHGTNQGPITTFTYSATEASLQTGLTVWLHLNTGPTFTNGIDVKWLKPDGTYNDLIIDAAADASTINGYGNIRVTLPAVSCSTPGTDEYHTISFNDGRDASGARYIYYMTFMVDC